MVRAFSCAHIRSHEIHPSECPSSAAWFAAAPQRPRDGPRMRGEGAGDRRETGQRIHEGVAFSVLSSVAAEEEMRPPTRASLPRLQRSSARLARSANCLGSCTTMGYGRCAPVTMPGTRLSRGSLGSGRQLGARDESVTTCATSASWRCTNDGLMTRCVSSKRACRSQPKGGWHFNVAFNLSGVACAFAAAGGWSAAARLFGAAEALFEHLAQPVDDYARPSLRRRQRPVRECLGEVELAEAWAAGRALSEADATAYALKAVTERQPR